MFRTIKTKVQTVCFAAAICTISSLASPFATATTRDSAKSSELDRAKAMSDDWLTNEKGEKVRFYSDLVRGNRVAINFIFTSCTMTCPPVSAISASVSKKMQADQDFRFISISIDPEHDTPELLLAHRQKYLKGADANAPWTLLTGDRQAVARVLASLGQSLDRQGNHDPVYILRNDRTGESETIRGLSNSQALLASLKKLASTNAQARLGGQENGQENGQDAGKQPQNHRYFSDEVFTDQDGKKHRLYSDLLRGKKVLINFGFTHCNAVCSPATRNLREVQQILSRKMGKEIVFLTFTVDPDHDTPAVMKKFANKHQVGPGWYFLTANKATTEKVLKKLGGWTDLPDNHSGVLLYGDVDKGFWSKSSSMEQPNQIAYAITNISNETLF